MKKFYSLLLILFFISCKKKSTKIISSEINQSAKSAKIVPKQQLDTIEYTDGFDFPVGKPDAKKYYNAQGFGKNDHLGDDWNGVNGGNSDLKDPIYSIANGYVVVAENFGGGWGNIIRIVHYRKSEETVESLYAHCNAILVKKGTYVTKGQKIGTIGTNNGQYYAHLHLELRNIIDLPIGSGYSNDSTGYLNATTFINNNRK